MCSSFNLASWVTENTFSLSDFGSYTKLCKSFQLQGLQIKKKKKISSPAYITGGYLQTFAAYRFLTSLESYASRPKALVPVRVTP